MVFQHKDNTVCILVKKVPAQYHSEMGYYHKIGDARELGFSCVRLSDLKSHCCLPSYTIGKEQVIVLKHAILD